MKSKLYFVLFFLLSIAVNTSAYTVQIRVGAQCGATTAFTNYTPFNEGQVYTVENWTLPSNFSSVQPLYNALIGSSFEVQAGALAEDIKIDWILWGLNCTNGSYLPIGNIGSVVFNSYYIVYKKVGNDWIAQETYDFVGDKKAVIKLKNTAGFQALLTLIPGGAINLGFAYLVNGNAFNTTGLTVTPPSPLTDVNQYWVLTAEHFSEIVGANKNQITAVNDNGNLPSSFELSQNYPNPFNPSTAISYSVPERSNVELSVYNVLGIKVATLIKGVKEAGNYDVKFDGSGLSSGLYIYELKTNKLTLTRKMMLLK